MWDDARQMNSLAAGFVLLAAVLLLAGALSLSLAWGRLRRT